MQEKDRVVERCLLFDPRKEHCESRGLAGVWQPPPSKVDGRWDGDHKRTGNPLFRSQEKRR